MKRDLMALTTGLAVIICPLAAIAADPIEEVLAELNTGNHSRSVKATKEHKSYPVLFKAYLNLSEPPIELGEVFNQTTIHPGMMEWSAVSGWAESNAAMAEAILESESKTLFGLSYGAANVEAEFRDAGLIADIGAGGSLRNNLFPYMEAIDEIAAFATAESYRLFEAGKTQDGLDLAMANIFVLRQCCDREFLAEQTESISMLTEALVNLRDMFYLYQDQITPEQYGEIASMRIPHLRPDRQRLMIPEGDKVVSSALIKEVFDSRGQADREKFGETFAAIQSADEPLTRFGAARRWRMIAEVHDSEEASQDRLTLVYDDWWRRWRVEEYDPILGLDTQFERTNPIRLAAVLYSMENIEDLFFLRNELLASVYGTAMAAGVCGYNKQFGKDPRNTDMTYATFVRKISDRDPFDYEFKPFKYRVLNERFAVDTPYGRLWLESGQGILYSKGLDHEDNRGAEHTDDGAAGDVVLWPPIRAFLRKEGLLN